MLAHSINSQKRSIVEDLPELSLLWSEALGDPRVCIAILDGPVDESHPCLDSARLTRLETLASGVANEGFATQHGTHVASIIFGQHGSSVHGIAPKCRGIVVPVFSDGDGSWIPCSQLDLARAIIQAVEHGANVINISGGQLTQSTQPDPILAKAVQLCADKNVLIVAAAGNDGCDCLHIPAAISSVLAVGAMDSQGNPVGFSNWGKAYQTQGILAPGENILGAAPNGGTSLNSGTSFATPIVSGIIALLLSIQLARGYKPDPQAIRSAILSSALPCNPKGDSDCDRFLAGILNIPAVYALIIGEEEIKVSGINKEQIVGTQTKDFVPINATNVVGPAQEKGKHKQGRNIEQQQPLTNGKVSQEELSAQSQPVGIQAVATMAPVEGMTAAHFENSELVVTPSDAVSSSVQPKQVTPSEGCSCGGSGPMQLVYALGSLGYDLGSEANRDAFAQDMQGALNPSLQQDMLTYLGENPHQAQAITWTLNLDATPIYAVMPMGAFAKETYERLRTFLEESVTQNAEIVSIPGVISGSVRLMSGQVVPVIVPNHQGMYNWNIEALVSAAPTAETCQSLPEGRRPSEEDLSRSLGDYLARIYYEFRNLGQTPEERALNFTATNAFEPTATIAEASGRRLELDSINVERSPICRPDSECYDVQLVFFNPENLVTSRRVFRYTVDVSHVLPVTIGRVRSWPQR